MPVDLITLFFSFSFFGVWRVDMENHDQCAEKNVYEETEDMKCIMNLTHKIYGVQRRSFHSFHSHDSLKLCSNVRH